MQSQFVTSQPKSLDLTGVWKGEVNVGDFRMGAELALTRTGDNTYSGLIYQIIKSAPTLQRLEAKKLVEAKFTLSACNTEQLDFTGLLNAGLKNFFRLDSVYEKGDTERKREVISSMYLDKLTFDGDNFRTPA